MKTDRVASHARLAGEQRDASDPREDVWLSASAGTGKTYVLSARVLRLLLRGAKPDAILCLTFTKAGAAEMARRVHERLAYWVTLERTKLFGELEALGEPSGPDAVEHARTLFAKVLEARGGGLRIMTIHAFCQTLLAGFPLEAGLVPGFRPIEGREQAALAQTVLAELVVTAEREGDARLIADLRALSLRLGEDGARAYLLRAARQVEALETLPDGIEPLVRRALDIPAEFDPADIADACCDDAIDRASLLELTAMLDRWGSLRGSERVEIVSNWLHGSPSQRADELSKLARAWCKTDGTLFEAKGWVPVDPAYRALAERLHAWCSDLCRLKERAELARDIASALNAARRFARDYAAAKRTGGYVDFDDLIRRVRELLLTSGMGDWIRYKLDQATDHILVDEAQDTNADQWSIVAGLAAEFWAGEGAKGDKLRTIFTVGDFKQAIFGFQGTDPDEYRGARDKFVLRAAEGERTILDLSLNRSFRSSQPVLDVVDALIARLGVETMGVSDDVPPHVSANGGPGSVTLLAPLTADDETGAEGEEGWLPTATRKLAGALAKQVRRWLDDGLVVKGRPLQPQDVMILVRKRSDLAALLVARLHAEGVPVAGVDRLSLQAPLAIKDLLACVRFAVQPEDDLNLAALLVSPLIGWTQDELFDAAHGRTGRLWHAVEGPARAPLLAMLNAADRATPSAFLEELLSGPLQARKRLLRRLGEEARDPIEELLNAAYAFEREGVASLQGFLDWFDRGEGEIVRDPSSGGAAVRVMTVHAAKGLQAPLVILADAAGDPDKSRAHDFSWYLGEIKLPLFPPRGAERDLVESLSTAAEDAKARDRREHWRLLYVAATRAEERLVIAGSLGVTAKGVPHESWHSAFTGALADLGATPAHDATWGEVLHFGDALISSGLGTHPANDTRTRAPGVALEPWLDAPAPSEARPPRPLAPSSIGSDDTASPPAGAALRAAAQRGQRLHMLFERLPSIAAENRRAAGFALLAHTEDREKLVDAALEIIAHPDFAAVFAVDALAEAPVAGVVDGVVIAGTVDRLVVTDRVIEIVDFKTGRRVPPTLDAIPDAHLRQMAAYAAVLQGIFPDRQVIASLLYTEGPVLHRLPPALLLAHKPYLAASQENLPAAG